MNEEDILFRALVLPIDAVYEGVILTPDEDPHKPARLSRVGSFFNSRHGVTHNKMDLDKAISAHDDAVRLTPQGSSDMPARLDSLGGSLLERYGLLQDLVDLEKAIAMYESAMRLAPDGNIDRLRKLGTSLFHRFERLGNVADINRSIDVKEKAVRICPDGHEDKPHLLTILGNSFLWRFRHAGNVADIDKSIEMHEDAVRRSPDGHLDRPACLTNLGNSLMCRFERFGNVADIDRSISAQEDAVRLTRGDPVKKASHLGNLGDSLLARFEHLGNVGDIDKSISVKEEAIQLLPDGHPDRPRLLTILGFSLLRRFERIGNTPDLDRAIIAQEEGVRLLPDDNVEMPLLLTQLGNSLVRRFERFGRVADLDKSVSEQEKAVQLSPDGIAAKPGRLSNLGSALMFRFECLGNATDLDSAIVALEKAVKLSPDGHPQKPMFLSNFGISLIRRFERFKNVPDIDSAVAAHENAVRLSPDGAALKPSFLANLGSSLHSRFEHSGNLADVEKSIQIKDEALRLFPDGHADKPGLLIGLGVSLVSRFESLGYVGDIDRAIAVGEKAVNLTPDGHADKPGHLDNLGTSFRRRFEHLGDVSDLNAATLRFSSAARSSIGLPRTRFRAVVQWAECNLKSGTSSMEAYSCALQLLPLVAWLGLPIPDRHSELIKIGEVVCHAVAAAIEWGQLHTAMEWFEKGRTIVWQQLLNFRSPVDTLRARDPALADHLEQTSIALERASIHDPLIETVSHLSMEEVGRNHRQLASEWDELVERVRGLPGFEDFLQPSRLSQLMGAARSGPVVVINMHERRCDALILVSHLDQVLHVPLEALPYDQAKALQDSLDGVISAPGIRSRSQRDPIRLESDSEDGKFKEILSELWLGVVKPVLDALAFPICQAADPPRIWWCPTGPLTFLPLHAAGFYDTDNPGSKISDFVASSYTPTLAALLDTPRPIRYNDFELLAVTQPSTPGQSHLPNTEQEYTRIQECAGQLRIQSLRGVEATVERVIQGMKECGWIHLACHGMQDVTNPTKSALLLQDGQLTIAEIIKSPLPHAQLAFLSACQTAAGDRRLSEEAVHLAAGMLLAGYRSVIATTWSIKDNDAPVIAEEVYRRLFMDDPPDPTQSAHALHHAVQRLRQSGVSFLSWVPFIHVGM